MQSHTQALRNQTGSGTSIQVVKEQSPLSCRKAQRRTPTIRQPPPNVKSVFYRQNLSASQHTPPASKAFDLFTKNSLKQIPRHRPPKQRHPPVATKRDEVKVASPINTLQLVPVNLRVHRPGILSRCVSMPKSKLFAQPEQSAKASTLGAAGSLLRTCGFSKTFPCVKCSREVYAFAVLLLR
jgi:hypothetical protein